MTWKQSSDLKGVDIKEVMAVKRLHLSYNMLIEYSEAVQRCNFTIKCIPTDTCRQKINNVKIKITPEVKYSYGKDGLNNLQVYGVCDTPHNSFEFHIEADAETGLSEYETDTNKDLDMVFSHEHGLNAAGSEIKAFHTALSYLNDIENDYEKSIELMHELSRKFKYVSKSTDVNTSAEEAFIQGFGVCQDYAHIYIALLHLSKVPARYVTGFIVGEGESHAWVEILYNGKWYGLDPTHDRVVNDEYIKLGIGRDAKDCMINRGIMHGGGLHTQRVTVQVCENSR